MLVTPAGTDIVARARTLLRSMEELVDSATRLADPFLGTLRLGVIPTIGPYLLPDLVPRLRAAYPKLTLLWIEDKTETLMARLRDGKIEGAILALEADIGSVDLCDLHRERRLRNVALGRSSPKTPSLRHRDDVLELAHGDRMRAQYHDRYTLS